MIILTIALIMGAVGVAQAFGRFTWGLVLPSARDDLLGESNTLAGFFGTLNVTAYLLGTLLVAWAASRVSLIGLMRIGLVVSTSALAVAAFAPSGVGRSSGFPHRRSQPERCRPNASVKPLARLARALVLASWWPGS